MGGVHPEEDASRHLAFRSRLELRFPSIVAFTPRVGGVNSFIKSLDL